MLGTAVLLGRCQLAMPDIAMSADVQMRAFCAVSLIGSELVGSARISS